MANFSSFSSSLSSSSSSSHNLQVDQILAEAMDHIVLEQVASINCSSFTDSVLPSHIENRFRKLKTFPSSYPSSRPKLAPDSANESSDSVSGHQLSPENKGISSNVEGKKVNSPSGQSKVSNFGKISEDFEGKKVNSPSGQSKVSSSGKIAEDLEGEKVNSPSGKSKVSNFGKNSDVLEGKMGNSPSRESKVSSFRRRSGGGKGKKVNSQGGYDSSPSDSSSESINSPNLNVKKHVNKGKMGSSKYGSDSEEEIGSGGCLCFSPKRVSRKKKKKNGGGGGGGGGELGFGWGKDEELSSDLRSFSTKEQKRRMKEAMKEEEKIVKEAEKIVKWAKQVSARMDFDITDNDDDVDDVLSSDHSKHRFGGR